MRLTIVGSGDAFGSGGRFNTCFHLAAVGKNFLIDCGASTHVAFSDKRSTFVCVDCGQVTCLPDVEVKIAPPKGSKATSLGNITEVFLKGHCKACQS